MKTDYTKKFSLGNKSLMFKPFNTKSNRNLVSRSNQITMSKTGYYFSYAWTKRFGFDAFKTHYITWGSRDNNFVHFAIAEGDEGKSALEEMFGVTPTKIQNRSDPNSDSGFGGSCSALYKECLLDLYKEVCNTGSKRFNVEESFLDESKVVRSFYFQLPTFGESWTLISASDLDEDTSLSRVDGVYKYFDIDKNLIYIGQGSIRDRYRSSNDFRSSWGIEEVEYIKCVDKEERRSLEKKLIREFEEEHGRLPKYNKNRGG
jgi:hypothetical protein